MSLVLPVEASKNANIVFTVQTTAVQQTEVGVATLRFAILLFVCLPPVIKQPGRLYTLSTSTL